VKTKKSKRKYTIPEADVRIERQPDGGCFFVLPIKVVSEANQSEHWRVKHKRKKAQQKALLAYIGHVIFDADSADVTFMKLNRGGKSLDKDNLAGAFKHVQDMLARWLGVDDGDTDKVTWHYDQRPSKEAGIEILIRRKDGA